MECNKDEAIRAKDMAEKRMQHKDFIGARKMALKAQQLFPELEYLSQILIVCEVHYSADVKVNGQMDWYAILQVQPTADESSIRKQYRKLALVLHPDKNQFAGAEAAFKLIGEAQMILLDRAKRQLYDIKRNATVKSVPLKQASQRAGSSRTNSSTVNFNGIPQQQQQSFSNAPQTFSIMCTSCRTIYHSPRNTLNIARRCSNCWKHFETRDSGAKTVPAAVNPGQSSSGDPTTHIPVQSNNLNPLNQPGIVSSSTGIPKNLNGFSGINSEQRGGPADKSTDANVNLRGTSSNGVQFTIFDQKKQPSKFSNTDVGQKRGRKVVAERRGGPADKSTDAKMNLRGTSSNDVQFTNVDQKKQPSKFSNTGAGQKRGRKEVADSSDSDISADGAIPFEDQCDSTSARRRSSRHKPNVTYMDDRSDDDDFVQPPSKKLSSDMADASEDRMAGKQKDYILHEEKPSNGTEKAKEDAEKGSASVKEKSGDKARASEDRMAKKQKDYVLHEEKPSNGTEKAKEDAEKDSASVKEKSEFESGPSFASGLDNSLNQQMTFNYPDPEFFDFGNFRNPTRFARDQIWAIYDNIDGMPRFYARIRNLEGPGFRVRFTWLEHNPTNEDEIAWSNAELPVACGNYKQGKPELSEDLLMFSHQVKCQVKGKKKNSHNIYPREGEVWALFKQWNVNWSSDADSNRLYEYEVVEVLSNFAEGTGITVIPLVKIEGFVSLFMRAKAASFVISPGEVLKFSHNVPCYRLTGTERVGIPSGCLELDCASLPINFNEVLLSVSLSTIVGSANETTDKQKSSSYTKEVDGSQDLHPDTSKDVNVKMSHATSSHNPATQKNVPGQAQDPEIHVNEKHNKNNYNSNKDLEGSHEKDADEIDRVPCCVPFSSATFEIPETEFHRFEEEKKIESFECGQIWALYSDIDKYPKYYGYVRNVDIKKCKVQVAWLESCSQDEEEKRWLKHDMPVSCGNFEISRQSMTFNSTSVFSHHIAAGLNGKAQYTILPRVNEIWAVYKNWRVGWSRSDLEESDYDVVEIFEHSGSGMKVNILTRVDGYRAVFCVMRDGKATSTMSIPAGEYIRFSHRIPSFMLTNERGGKLMGCWELDTASVPELLLF